jgi:hypothetical protein
MRISASDLDQLLWFRRIEDMTTDDLIKRLRREEPPNRMMKVGTAFHSILEQPPEDELVCVERDGFNFIIECDGEVELPQMMEVKTERHYTIDGIDVTLVSKPDGIDGNVVKEYKLTAKPKPENYFDSYQWRAYLDAYSADIVEYMIFHAKDLGEDKGNQIIIKDVSPFRLYRYPGMRDDLIAGIREFVEFARIHLPERLER